MIEVMMLEVSNNISEFKEIKYATKLVHSFYQFVSEIDILIRTWMRLRRKELCEMKLVR